MDKKSFQKYVNEMFALNTLPALKNFIRIPNLSPGFDPNWKTNGLLDKAANLIVSFAKSLQLKNAEVDFIKDKGYSPLVFIDIPSTRPNDTRTILFYGHFDKQPHGTGWDPDKGPTKPVVINDRLYGRGSADDGYSSFSILTAIKACQAHNCLMPRICCIFEGAEESNDEHLRYYFNKLRPIIGDNVSLFIPLDSGCSDYERIWMGSSLRGFMEISFTIQTLDRDCNYGPEASGRTVDNLFVLRKILDGIYDSKTGEFNIPEFKVKEIPKKVEEDIEKEIKILGKEQIIKNIPLYDGVKPLKDDIKELLINNRWKPSISLYGIGDAPKFEDKGFSVGKGIKVSLCIRTPPGIDLQAAENALRTTIENNVYFDTLVDNINIAYGEGWNLSNLTKRTEIILNKASLEYFGNELSFAGCGGSIPFISDFQKIYPNADIICTGICGNDSYEHGPNENLNLTACKKMILSLCFLLSEI